ncbi:MAG: hypothetical protein D6725_07720 [Planctomycetota bacterium]|nr:MAG: hypothetical protein D6725_07720 [Planctomycetota bacterium]
MTQPRHADRWWPELFLLTVLVLAVPAAGCRRRVSSDLELQADAEAALEERCESLLASALDGAQPDRMGISSEAATVASTLNEWRTRCGGTAGSEVPDEAAELLERLLPPDTLQRTLATDFSVRDAMHLRNAIWFRRVTENIGRQTDEELQRVVQLFDYVVRTVVRTDDAIAALPKTVFGAALYGRGTAEDRAWLFAGLLTQMRIDAVILRAPDAQTDGSDGRWCVGVLLGDDCFLFDTRLGLPLPADMDQPTQAGIQRPLTLRRAVSEPRHLEALGRALGASYSLSVEDFRDVQVEIIGDSSLWAPRMAALQSALTGSNAVLIYSPLQDTAQGPGSWSRIAQGHQTLWEEQQCHIWRYPELRWMQQQSLDDHQQEQLSGYLSAFNAPTPIVHVREFQTVRTKDGKTFSGEVLQVDERGIAIKLPDEQQAAIIPRDALAGARLERLEFLYGPPQRQLLRTRIQHLLMDKQAAMTGYTVTRLWERFPPIDKNLGVPADQLAQFPQFVDPQVRQMHRRAAMHAFFWTGVSQFESGEYEAAAETLRRYILAHPGDDWESAARTLWARALIAADRPKDAIRVLEASRPQERDHATHRVLLARCRAVVANGN